MGNVNAFMFFGELNGRTAVAAAAVANDLCACFQIWWACGETYGFHFLLLLE